MVKGKQDGVQGVAAANAGADALVILMRPSIKRGFLLHAKQATTGRCRVPECVDKTDWRDKDEKFSNHQRKKHGALRIFIWREAMEKIKQLHGMMGNRRLVFTICCLCTPPAQQKGEAGLLSHFGGPTHQDNVADVVRDMLNAKFAEPDAAAMLNEDYTQTLKNRFSVMGLSDSIDFATITMFIGFFMIKRGCCSECGISLYLSQASNTRFFPDHYFPIHKQESEQLVQKYLARPHSQRGLSPYGCMFADLNMKPCAPFQYYLMKALYILRTFSGNTLSKDEHHVELYAIFGFGIKGGIVIREREDLRYRRPGEGMSVLRNHQHEVDGQYSDGARMICLFDNLPEGEGLGLEIVITLAYRIMKSGGKIQMNYFPEDALQVWELSGRSQLPSNPRLITRLAMLGYLAIESIADALIAKTLLPVPLRSETEEEMKAGWLKKVDEALLRAGRMEDIEDDQVLDECVISSMMKLLDSAGYPLDLIETEEPVADLDVDSLLQGMRAMADEHLRKHPGDKRAICDGLAKMADDLDDELF